MALRGQINEQKGRFIRRPQKGASDPYVSVIEGPILIVTANFYCLLGLGKRRRGGICRYAGPLATGLWLIQLVEKTVNVGGMLAIVGK